MEVAEDVDLATLNVFAGGKPDLLGVFETLRFDVDDAEQGGCIQSTQGAAVLALPTYT